MDVDKDLHQCCCWGEIVAHTEDAGISTMQGEVPEKVSGTPCVILNINEGIEINNIFESNFCLIISSDSGMLYKAIRHLIDHEVLMPKTGYMTTSLCCAPPLLLLWPCIQLESSQRLPASPRLSQHASFSLPALVEQHQKHAAKHGTSAG